MPLFRTNGLQEPISDYRYDRGPTGPIGPIGPPGPTGPVGPPGTGGEYVGTYRKISSAGSITASDSTIEIECGGSDFSVALPTATELLTDGKSKQVRVYRNFGDTGDLTLTGDGSELIDSTLLPGESIMIESNGTNLLFNG